MHLDNLVKVNLNRLYSYEKLRDLFIDSAKELDFEFQIDDIGYLVLSMEDALQLNVSGTAKHKEMRITIWNPELEKPRPFQIGFGENHGMTDYFIFYENLARNYDPDIRSYLGVVGTKLQ